MTKGADNIINPRLVRLEESKIDATNKLLEGYSVEGLRTLLVAFKTIPLEEY